MMSNNQFTDNKPIFADYIVFADESGDHGLAKIDASFPMFALSFCMIEKSAYVGTVVPAFQQFKFDFWGHDGVVLHEHEIRRRKGPFALLLTNPDLRARFYDRLNGLITATPMSIVASVINKFKLKAKYVLPSNPYELALYFVWSGFYSCFWSTDKPGELSMSCLKAEANKKTLSLSWSFAAYVQTRETGDTSKQTLPKSALNQFSLRKLQTPQASSYPISPLGRLPYTIFGQIKTIVHTR